MRTIAIALVALVGCIDEFHGSNVQIDFATATPVQAHPGAMPSADELPNNIHLTLFAFSEGMDANGVPVGHLFELQRFELHRIVDLESPCYIDVGKVSKNVPFPGLHVSQFSDQIKALNGIDDIEMPPADATEEQKIDAATAIQRQRNILALAGDAGIKVVTSASDGAYPEVGADCSDTAKIPPPACADAASNARRLKMCEAAWEADPSLYEGSDRVLTLPLNGKTDGFVIGENPINFAPVGGAQWFIDESLDDFQGFAIYWQYDDVNDDGMPDYPASVPADERTEHGQLMLFGRAEQPTRGVIHVPMTSLLSPAITADLAIFANIDEDDVHF